MKFFILAILLLVIFFLLYKKFKKKIFKIIWIIIFLILVSELLFRIFEPFIRINPMWVADEKLGFKVRANYLHTNSNGFNDIERSISKNKNMRRIIVFGDSFSWACGYEGNYISLLDKYFKKSGNVCEVLNFGYPAIGPGYLYNLLLEKGLNYNPDTVILSFFVGNDFDESKIEKEIFTTIRFGNPHSLIKKHFFRITEESYLFYFFDHFRKIILNAVRKKIDDASENKMPDSTFSIRDFMKIERTRLKVCRNNFYLEDEAWENTKNAIMTFKKLLDSKSIDFILIILPDQFQSDNKLQKQLFQNFKDLKFEEFDFDLPQKKLKEFCSANSIRYIDVLPEFKEKSETEELYLPRDTHFNVKGNKLCAETVFKRLTTFSSDN